MKPFLVEGKKFDLRYFVAIPCTKPFFALFYRGFIRKSLFDFTIDNDGDSKDAFVHITNVQL